MLSEGATGLSSGSSQPIITAGLIFSALDRATIRSRRMLAISPDSHREIVAADTPTFAATSSRVKARLSRLAFRISFISIKHTALISMLCS